MLSGSERYLQAPAEALAAVGGLVGHLHVTQVQPGEGPDRPGVVLQVCDEALCRGRRDVKHQPVLRRLGVGGVQRGSAERGEDELVHLQDGRGHEAGLGGLVLHRALDQNRQPQRL